MGIGWGLDRPDSPSVRAPGRFLTAQWLDLLMLNFAVDPGLLGPHVPPTLAGLPQSAFVAEGSAITVFRPRRLTGAELRPGSG